MPEIIPCPDQITSPKGGDEDSSFPSGKHKQILHMQSESPSLAHGIILHRVKCDPSEKIF